MENKTVIVVGAGASGMMAAGRAAEGGRCRAAAGKKPNNPGQAKF